MHRLGNIASRLERRPGGAGFDYTKIVIGQQIVQVELVVPLTSNAVGAVLDQRLAVGTLGGAESHAPSLALVQGLQILIIEVKEVAPSHVGQAGIAVAPVAGEFSRGGESAYTFSVECGSGQIVCHSVAV